MKKILINLCILPAFFLVGCSDYIHNNNKPEPAENTNAIPNIFSGLWVRNDGGSNTYFKIRETSIEYQSNDTFFNNYDLVKEIIFDDMGENLYLTLATHYEDNEDSTVHIEIYDSDTIKLQGKVLTRVFDIDKAAKDLAPIFTTNCPEGSDYNLESFLEISKEDLNRTLSNKSQKD